MGPLWCLAVKRVGVLSSRRGGRVAPCGARKIKRGVRDDEGVVKRRVRRGVWRLSVHKPLASQAPEPEVLCIAGPPLRGNEPGQHRGM